MNCAMAFRFGFANRTQTEIFKMCEGSRYKAEYVDEAFAWASQFSDVGLIESHLVFLDHENTGMA